MKQEKELTLPKGQLNYKAIPLLSYLSEEEFRAMDQQFTILTKKKGDPIFQAGDPAEVMYILYKGEMKISMNLSDGREQLMYIYTEGDFVGGLNLLSGDRYVYNGTALTDSIVITISRRDFHEVLLHNNQFLISVLEKSYERIRKSEALIDVLAGINADMRVAKVLLNFVNIYGEKTEGGVLLKLNINREEMGSYSGITRETMSRKLNQFENRGILELLPRGQILIKDIQQLQELSL